MMGYFTAPRIAFGVSAIEQLEALGARHPLVLASPTATAAPRFRHALEELAKGGGTPEVLTAGSSSLTLVGVEELAGRVRTTPDWIVAIGGGRTIDTARALWALRALPDVPLDRRSPVMELDPRTTARFTAVPTTIGAGTEVGWTSLLTDRDGRWFEVSGRELTADWVVADPTFLSETPTSRLAAGAAAATLRALEAYLSPWANPLSDAPAAGALAVLVPGLARLERHRDADLEATLQLAGLQAGMAGSNAPGGLALPLTTILAAALDRPFGRVAAAALPAVLEFTYPSVRDRLATLSGTFGSEAGTSRAAVSGRLRSALSAAGLGAPLSDAGERASSAPLPLEELVPTILRAPGVAGAPRIPTAAELGRLIECVRAGTPVDF